MDRFCSLAPAKLNLHLEVVGLRPDGYHELRSLMVPLSVGDQVTLMRTREGVRIRCDRPEIPVGDDSLLARAFRYAAHRFAYPGGVKIELAKQLPVGSGLGGGSSDAAAVIRGMAALTGHPVSPELYPEVAFELGADIPFFLEGKGAWVGGIGERVRPAVIYPDCYFLLVYPGTAIATAWVYRQLTPPLLTRSTAPTLRPSGRRRRRRSGSILRASTELSRMSKPRPSGRGVEGLTSGTVPDSVPPPSETWQALLQLLNNDLESVVLPHYPLLGAVKRRLQVLGGDAALMSGSGSTVFGLFSQKEKRDEALAILRAEHPEWWLVGAEPLRPSGVV